MNQPMTIYAAANGRLKPNLTAPISDMPYMPHNIKP